MKHHIYFPSPPLPSDININNKHHMRRRRINIELLSARKHVIQTHARGLGWLAIYFLLQGTMHDGLCQAL